MHGVEKNARMQEVCLQCMHRNFLDIDHECMQFVLCPSLQVWRLDGATQERLDIELIYREAHACMEPVPHMHRRFMHAFIHAHGVCW